MGDDAITIPFVLYPGSKSRACLASGPYLHPLVRRATIDARRPTTSSTRWSIATTSRRGSSSRDEVSGKPHVTHFREVAVQGGIRASPPLEPPRARQSNEFREC